MAEESDLEKTEAPSPRRLEKAREEGQVARSRELNTFLLLSAGVGMLWLGGGRAYHELRGILRTGLWFDPLSARDTDVMVASAAMQVWRALLTLLPFFGLLVVVAILASVLLGGFLWSTKALEPKFNRMSPLKGLQRMFSAHTLVELFKTLAKAGLIGTIAALVISHYQERMLTLMYAWPTEALTTAMSLVALCSALIVGSLLLIVLIDAPWQLFSHFKKMRMSRQDLKQEHKESEGDPHVKGRIRQQQRAMARRRRMAEVPSADVVVTNPTHYAVALSYREGGQGAPRVVAKGQGMIAARIRELAQEHRVPLISAPPLARALHRHVELEQEIPVALYTAVAEILAWVYQLRHWRQGGGPAPVPPSDLPVPASLDPATTGSAA